MNDREAMLRRLSSAQFAAWEMHMFLDTHPHNRQAFDMYTKYLERANMLKKEFEEQFGPISSPDSFDNGHWTWNDSPWPWENDKEGK